MSTHKLFDRICCIAMVVALLITVAFLNGEALGIQAADRVMGYEDRLFNAEEVHTIDIIIEDWESFLSTCQSEEYSACSVVIDGEAYKNVGIRGKGNTSLSTVSSMDSDRYSFKIEFDQYDSTNSYYGLDKLCLNNIIQDNTYMKDFLVYQMMNEFGVDAPLCSYVYITVNGEDWGLYLAVEGVEDSFLQRTQGSDYGELYKPDSMSMGGGRGNGREFDMENMDFSQFEGTQSGETPQMPGQSVESGEMPQIPGQSAESGEMPQMPGQSAESGEMPQMPGQGTESGNFGNRGNRGDAAQNMGGGGFGMGSDDVKLQYIDDEAESYSNIFDNAKTEISEADQERLIASLKALSEGENIEEVVDIEAVIRYFVVHNFVVNGDSYTGSMIHNYYLYEEDGLLSMIPWDYNLAFGTFQGSDAESAVNDPIDTPVSGDMSDRPMVSWIFESEEYTELYHQYFEEFLTEIFDSGSFAALVDSTAEMIAPYVEKDPTKFCTYEEFELGVETIREFCLLRAESVRGQLEGSIPSTSEGQTTDNSTLVDAATLTLSDMGTMNNGMNKGMGGFGGAGNFGEGAETGGTATEDSETSPSFGGGENSQNGVLGNRGNRDEMSQNTEAQSGQMPNMPGSEGMPQTPGMSESAGSTENGGMLQMPEMAGNGGGSAQTLFLMVSLVILLAGLLIVFGFKR